MDYPGMSRKDKLGNVFLLILLVIRDLKELVKTDFRVLTIYMYSIKSN